MLLVIFFLGQEHRRNVFSCTQLTPHRLLDHLFMWGVLRQRLPPVIAFMKRNLSSKFSPDEVSYSQKIKARDAEARNNAPLWVKRDQAHRARYGAWNPTKKLSRQQMDDIRDLKQKWPQMKTKQLADFFHVNPESIRRILKSQWMPNEAETEDIRHRTEVRKQKALERKKEVLRSGSGARSNHTNIKSVLRQRDVGKARTERQVNARQKKPFIEGVGDLID